MFEIAQTLAKLVAEKTGYQYVGVRRDVDIYVVTFRRNEHPTKTAPVFVPVTMLDDPVDGLRCMVKALNEAMR